MSSCRVLIVEDDENLQDVLAHALSSAGIHSVGVNNGQEALEWLRANPAPTVLLLDLAMPVMDGNVFRRESLAEGYDIPTIVMSGCSDVTKYAEALKADGYLRKPFALQDLLKAMGKFLEAPAGTS